MCNFFVVPGNGQALLGMQHIDILNILIVSCNTVGTEEADKDVKNNTNRTVTHGAEVSSTIQIQ